ncbi:MAG: hypothetical protein QNJ98_12330 [Planctomycetota bacterium]|nr:hypothetical protein [Planctomycetota bacterium]
MRTAWWIALALVGICVTGCGKRAKPAPHPLEALLASVPVPETEFEQEQLRCLEYLDLRAAERVAGVEAPESMAAFSESTRDDQQVWIRALDRAAHVSVDFLSVFRSAKGMPAALGFDFFHVDRIVAFGSGPGPSQLFAGRFDAAAIAAAHERRGYTRQELDDVAAAVWRHGDGTQDLVRDLLAQPDPSNPLGGRIGLQQPIALLEPDLVASAPTWSATLALAKTHQNARKSVLSLPPYRSAVKLLVRSSKDDRTLVQAQLWRPAEFQLDSVGAWIRTRLGERAGVEAVAEVAKAQVGNVDRLPPYELACLADGQDGEDQAALIALVFATKDDAERGVDVLAERVTTFKPFRSKTPEPLVERVAGTIETHVVKGVEGRRIAVVVIRYPLPENERRGRLFTYWTHAIMNREFLPIMRFAND